MLPIQKSTLGGPSINLGHFQTSRGRTQHSEEDAGSEMDGIERFGVPQLCCAALYACQTGNSKTVKLFFFTGTHHEYSAIIHCHLFFVSGILIILEYTLPECTRVFSIN